MGKFQNKYCIPSARANWHNYNGGVYFVTICTKNREHYFGEITHCCRNVVRICRDVARNVYGNGTHAIIMWRRCTHCRDVARNVSTIF